MLAGSPLNTLVNTDPCQNNRTGLIKIQLRYLRKRQQQKAQNN